ncbi:YT521-B-like domain-containing protein [Mycena epipterygia]|nr:YT521-B-like domain-containing protein [Mycena epipterygia]
MSMHGRAGSDQSRPGRRQSQSSQQRRLPPGYPPLTTPASTQGQHVPPTPPTTDVQYPPPLAAYPGQYMMAPQPLLTMAHTLTPTFAYPPAFRVQDQAQSIHAGYPTPAAYPQYPLDPPPPPEQLSAVYGPSVHYPSPMAGGYTPYAPSTSALYTQQQHVYPVSSYPQFAHAPGAAPQGMGGTWWYVPAQQQQQQQHRAQYEAGISAYPFYPPPQTDQLSPPSPSSPSASSPIPPGRDRPLTRRVYHSNPPVDRSEWVMWVGNVSSDAVHDELWRFFTQLGDGGSSSSINSSSTDESPAHHGGVRSIFLISRSSCAFVNYETEAYLQAAIARFDGVPMRADPRGARLTCRVRRKDDDMRAGVGGQRGMGMHARWVKANVEKDKSARDDAEDTSASDAGTMSRSSDPTRSLAASMSGLSLDPSAGDARAHSDPLPPRPHAEGSNSNSSGSFASTTSSLLQRHFPQRFFILKSHTEDDLDLSVRTGIWATQRHNESTLDRAFRTSQDVFLIFSVNKSGEWYGYARLAGPVEPVDSARAFHSGAGAPTELIVAMTSEPITTPTLYAPEPPLLLERLVDNSLPPFSMPLRPVNEQGEEQGTPAESRGQDFKLHWICTERLPFPRTRHIRNPWNQDREIKVSRDGTELAPFAGHALLEEWRLFLAAATELQASMKESGPSRLPGRAGIGSGGRGGGGV